MFSDPGLIFGGTEGVASRFHVLRSQIRFRWFRGRRVPLSCFARPNSFSEVPRATGPVFLFCAPEIIFGGTGGVRSLFHDFVSRTRFWRYRGRLVPFSCFALSESFPAVPRESRPFFMFCSPGLVFGSTGGDVSLFYCFALPDSFFGYTEGIGSHFHVLRSRTHFRRYGGRRVPFSCFALPNSFSTVPSASGPVFMFCAPELVFSGTGGDRSLFCFMLPDSFSAVRRASGHIFLFCAPGIVFDGAECVGSRFHVFRSRTRFWRYRRRRVPFLCFALLDSFSLVPRASGSVFLFCAPGLIFVGTEGVGSRFHVLRSRTHFRRYRERRVPISAVTSALGPVFMFCAPGLVFGSTGGDWSLFLVLRPRTHFSTVLRASGPILMCCAPGIVFGGTVGVGSRFHVLRSRTRLWRYRGRRVPFSCFALPDSFSAVLRAWGPIFLF
jgi:hypothetical protein